MASAASTSVTGNSGLMLDDVQERADYWKKLLWEATLSTDSELVEDRHEVVSFRNMLNALYDGVPRQTAASSALANTNYRHLQRLAEVSDDGLKRLQPELRRGQQRVLLIVSDSTIVFCKGSKRRRNFMKVMPNESLQQECKKDGGFSSYREIVCSPLWGKTLSHITDEVETQLEALRLKYPQYAGDTLLVDVLIFWSGNELTGHYGVFLDPGFNEDGYIWQGQAQLHIAQGDFCDISRRVCRCVDRLSSLKAKQHTGFTALNGNVRHDLFCMPAQYNEVMSLFWAYAEKSGLLTATLTGLAELQVFHDKFDWKVDSESMRRLVKYTVELTTQLRAKHAASLMGMLSLDEVATQFPWREMGFYRRRKGASCPCR